ncbi:MAG TPA: DEAD/DEAH box helicase [Gemmatimonadales bacterium]|nr:DEAD/DEAH box helicase [Gemmatimonadales bacterium]
MTAPSWAPRIVAEALISVPDPLRTGLAAGPPAPAAQIARALAASLLPAERPAVAPPWLLPGQARGYRRALAAIERFGGGLLADPVGSGKTYIALAVAAALQGRRPTACLVPAPLATQWRLVAARLGVAVEVGTHQQASRGRLPSGTAGLVVIDESHHFRHPRTRRYAHVARWLLGRPVLLLSATPVVNRADDLAHQLLLGVRDDALLADGVASLRVMLASARGTSALGRLVIEDTAEAGGRPVRAFRTSPAGDEECAISTRSLALLASLRLSHHPPTAALVRSVLQRAAGSSPAALAGALRRYRGLLLHARDARQAGRALSRAELRSFAGELDDQLVLWELVAEGGGEQVELSLEDLERLDGVIDHAASAAAGEDPKLERLRALLADAIPTLVFTTRRETVRHLRDRLGPPAVAWCTGERAGIGRTPLARPAVLEWFREEPPIALERSAPRCLVVTDVAAEGLDLRRAGRVVHYDLPWTPMRLEQREGRAVRLGSALREVEVVRFLPSPALEAELRVGERLARKALLPGRAGLGAEGIRLWRWRSVLADRMGTGPSIQGTAAVCGAERGVLAGFELLARGGGVIERTAAVVGWMDAGGRWSEDETIVTQRLLEAARAEESGAIPAAALGRALGSLAGPIRARLALAAGRRWTAAEPESCARRLAVRLQAAVREAARRRDIAGLGRLERALAFVAGGHTAGESELVARLADAPAPALAAWTGRLPAPTARREPVEARLTGLVLFETRQGGTANACAARATHR